MNATQTEDIMSDDKCPNPTITNLVVTYSQEGNTLGTTDTSEDLIVCLEFPCLDEEEPFVVIKTDGWSMDNASEITALIDRTLNFIKVK